MRSELAELVREYERHEREFGNKLFSVVEEMAAGLGDKLRAISEEELLFLIDAGMALLKAKRSAESQELERLQAAHEESLRGLADI